MSTSGHRPRVVLVGPMGAGKTTVADILAERWGTTVRDTDRDIEAAEGRPIPAVFIDEGEAYFRSRERESVADALAEHSGVLALGGGAVLDESTQLLLAGHVVVFLNVGFADAVKRVGLGAGRPMLLGNVRSQVKALLDARLPLYTAVASVTVQTDGRTPQQVADEVVAAVQSLEPQDAEPNE